MDEGIDSGMPRHPPNPPIQALPPRMVLAPGPPAR